MNDLVAGHRSDDLTGAGAGHIAVVLAFHLTLLAITIAPLAAVSIPPLTDLPNHLARLHILAHRDTIPELQANYEIVPTLTPYLLVDWLLTPLARIWDVYTVGRAFVVATMVVTYAGLLSLSVTLFGRLTVWPAVALPALYNHAFSWGFLNFSFGVGLLFLAMSLWIRLRFWTPIMRFWLLLGLSALLYLTHMLIFGLFALLLSANSLSIVYNRSERPTLTRVFSEFLPIVTSFLLTFIVYAIWTANDGAQGVRTTEYGDIARKVVMFASPTQFKDGADLAFLGVYWVVGLILVRRSALQLAPGMGYPLISLTILCLLMPNKLLGVFGVDFRFPPILLMLAVAVTQPIGVAGRRRPPAWIGLMAAFVIARAVTLWEPLQLADRQFQEFRQATQSIDKGARLLVTVDEHPETLALPSRAYWHLAQIAVIERGAFVPFMFTGVTQIRASARNLEIDTPSGPIPHSTELADALRPDFAERLRAWKMTSYNRIYWQNWPQDFDYLIRINPEPLDEIMARHLELIISEDFFELLRIREQ